MSAARMYCYNKFKKSLNNSGDRKAIHETFVALECEIKKLDPMIQINLYSAATQFLDSLVQERNDLINPLEVFNLRCQSIIGTKYNMYNQIVLGLAVVAISIAAIITGGAMGFGIGALLGMWQTPFMFMTALFAAELPAMGVAAMSASLGVGVGVLSGFMFFKEPKVKTALNNCIEAIKESYLTDSLEEMGQEEPNVTMQ